MATLVFTLLHAVSAAIPFADRYGPSWALLGAVWCGARARETSGVLFATLLGLGAGLFTTAPIAEGALMCVVASILAGTFKLLLGKTREAPVVIAAFSLVGVVLIEFGWQSSVSSHNVSAWSAAECLARFAATLVLAPVVFGILDRTRYASRI